MPLSESLISYLLFISEYIFGGKGECGYDFPLPWNTRKLLSNLFALKLDIMLKMSYLVQRLLSQYRRHRALVFVPNVCKSPPSLLRYFSFYLQPVTWNRVKYWHFSVYFVAMREIIWSANNCFCSFGWCRFVLWYSEHCQILETSCPIRENLYMATHWWQVVCPQPWKTRWEMQLVEIWVESESLTGNRQRLLLSCVCMILLLVTKMWVSERFHLQLFLPKFYRASVKFICKMVPLSLFIDICPFSPFLVTRVRMQTVISNRSKRGPGQMRFLRSTLTAFSWPIFTAVWKGASQPHSSHLPNQILQHR